MGVTGALKEGKRKFETADMWSERTKRTGTRVWASCTNIENKTCISKIV